MHRLRCGYIFWVRVVLYSAPLIVAWFLPQHALAADAAVGAEDTILLPMIANRSGKEESAPTWPAEPPEAASVTPDLVYYHYDATGNLLALTSNASEVVWRADVRPFGQGVASSADYPLGFNGQLREADLGSEGGLYPLGARYYDPLTGRFLSPEPLSLTEIPLEEPQRFNLYAFGLNNPYRYGDASGQQPEPYTPKKTLQILRHIAQDANLSPETRLAANQLSDVLRRTFQLLNQSPDPARSAAVKRALAAISSIRAFVAVRRISPQLLTDSLHGIGVHLRSTGRGAGRGGAAGAVILGLVSLPSVAEAASEERYGNAVLDVATLIIPFPKSIEEFESLRSWAGLSNDIDLRKLVTLAGLPEGYDPFRAYYEHLSEEIDKWLGGE